MVCWSVGWLVDFGWLVRWVAVGLASWETRQPAGWLVGWLSEWLVGLAGSLAGWFGWQLSWLVGLLVSGCFGGLHPFRE